MIKEKSFLKLCFIGILILSLGLLVGCHKDNPNEVSGKVSISGSSSLLPLLKIGQEEFYKKYDKVTVNLSAGGSYTGQNQVFNGAVDIGNSDVPLQESLQGKGLTEHILVGIPFVFIVNKDVTVNDLTKEQYKAILTGKITNWQEVGGRNQRITVINRPLSSGSRMTINKIVLDGENFTDDAIVQDSNGALRTTVETTPGAIGYVDASYANDNIKVLFYNGVKFTVDNVANGKYPVYTFGRMFTKNENKLAVREFIALVNSEEFQNNYVEKHGFIPLNKLKNRQ